MQSQPAPHSPAAPVAASAEACPIGIRNHNGTVVGPGPSDSGQNQTDHHSVFCPTCSSRLSEHRCKLICRSCGYFLSCADFY